MAPASDIAFSPTVKAIQSQRGSRAGYARMENKGDWQTTVTDELAAVLADVNSFYLASVSSAGQPYIQHRGGPAGFLKVLDSRTLGFADFRGNRQYITTGNLADNPRAFIFVMDYFNRRRIKLWGTARVADAGDALIKRLFPKGYDARPEQAMIFTLVAWDVNCPQHIPEKVNVETVREAVAGYELRIKALQAEIARLKQAGAVVASA